MKRKLTIAIFLIAALAVVISSTVGLFAFRQRELSAARESLTDLLNLMDAQSYDTYPKELVAQFATAAPNKRLTVLNRGGTVLADTAEIDPTTDHGTRPEIVAALRGGVGEATRRSASTGVTMLYVAKVLTDGNLGRAAMPISSVNALFAQGATGFLLAAVVAMLLAFLLAHKLAATAIKPVEQAEVALEQVDETLAESRMEFTANVTHELKTPLTSIKGFTDMLTGGLVSNPADQMRFLTMISVETDRLIALINDVLKISELESVSMPGTSEHCDLRTVADEVVQLLRPAAEGVILVVNGPPVAVALPAIRLREVVLNLAENAVKYNSAGGTVTLDIFPLGDRVRLEVSDTGAGIPLEAQPHVFERFYRADKGRSKRVGGTGLGLAIVKHIVKLYGGEIALTSALGVGTTVTVLLPCAGETV